MEDKREKIEVKIDEIIEYIGACKYKLFSSTEILVEKDTMESMLLDLKSCAPEEIKRYQKIISNREAIIAEAEKIRSDAKAEAEDIIKKATNKTNELISEHEIMQKAYNQCDQIIELAVKQAQEMIDNAVIESNSMKEAATAYTDSLLAHIQTLASSYVESSCAHFNSLIEDLNSCVQTVTSNREELYPAVEESIDAGNTTDFIPVSPAQSTSDILDLDMNL